MSSLPLLLANQAAAHGSKIALRHRGLGVWSPISWAEYAMRADQAGLGLQSIGVAAGDRVAVVMENTPDWLYAFIGIQSIGAVAVPVRPDTSPVYIGAALAKHNVKTVIVGDQEQFDKVQEQRQAEKLPLLKMVVIVDTRGVRSYDNPDRNTSDGIHSWSVMCNREGNATGLQSRAADLSDVAEAALIVPLDGDPLRKTNSDLVEMGSTAVKQFGIRASDETMAVSSFSDEHSIALDVLAPLHSALIVNIGHDAALLLNELREVRPTVMVSPTTLLERVKGDADRRAISTKGLKKMAYEASLRRGATRAASRKPRANDLPILLFASVGVAIVALVVSNAVKNGILRLAIPLAIGVGFALLVAVLGFAAARPVRNRYGLGRLRSLAASTTEVAKETQDWFWRLGVPLIDVSGVLSSASKESAK